MLKTSIMIYSHSTLQDLLNVGSFSCFASLAKCIFLMGRKKKNKTKNQVTQSLIKKKSYYDISSLVTATSGTHSV